MKTTAVPQKFLLFIIMQFSIVAAFAGGGSCISISCAGDLTVNNDSNACGAVVNYASPSITYNCIPYSQAFTYTGSLQTWKVPAGITQITVSAAGAQGGGGGSAGTGGYGALISGDFAVTPGDSLVILCGGMGGTGYGDGGGGGSFVFNVTQSAVLVAAGGGGGAGDQCGGAPGLSGLTTTDGGTSASNLSGGTGGNGGSSISYGGGGGGGLLGSGQDSQNGGGGGQSIISGAAGGAGVTGEYASGDGGFGGGGAGGNRGGGGGGGYSGGGGAVNGGGCGEGGGGGGSYNTGTNQYNQSGFNTGNGYVHIQWGNKITVTQTAGLDSGSVFPVGITNNAFKAADEMGDVAFCSFTVTVTDTEAPVIAPHSTITLCSDHPIATFSVSATDNCGIDTISYNYISGSYFPEGTTTVTATATDVHGNSSTSSFDIIVDTIPTVTLINLPVDTICSNAIAIALAGGLPLGGIYSGDGINAGNFDPTQVTPGNDTITYTFTDGNNCSSTATAYIDVEVCTGINALSENAITLYPNPAADYAQLVINGLQGNFKIEILDMLGRSVKSYSGIVETNNYKQLINVSDMPPAIYMVRVNAGNNRAAFTLSVCH